MSSSARNTRHRNAPSIKLDSEISLLEKACRVVAEVHILVAKYVKPGVKTLELDTIAEDYIRSKNAIPAFKGYQFDELIMPFPGSLCISVNEEVVHGIPGDRILNEGDIVSLDCGVLLNGYYGDSAVTHPVGNVSKDRLSLMRVTEESLYLGLSNAIDGNKLYDISRAIQTHCESNGFSLTRELVGHGIGTQLHEEPAIPNFVPPLLHRNKFPNLKLLKGMALAIEPMVHQGAKEVETLNDGWTIVTKDRSPAAHFEHTVVVDNNKPLILTARN